MPLSRLKASRAIAARSASGCRLASAASEVLKLPSRAEVRTRPMVQKVDLIITSKLALKQLKLTLPAYFCQGHTPVKIDALSRSRSRCSDEHISPKRYEK